MTYLAYLILRVLYLHSIREGFAYVFIFRDRLATVGVDNLEILEGAKVVQYCSGLKDGQCAKLKNPWKQDVERFMVQVCPVEEQLPEGMLRWKHNVPIVRNVEAHMYVGIPGIQ